MDYKRVRKNTSGANREKILKLITLVMACIIILQAIAIAVLFASVKTYRAMYSESLDTQVIMQEEINRLSEEPEVGENYDDGGEIISDIPFVTEGRELEDESSIGD